MTTSPSHAPRVLLVSPRFNANSFWGFEAACALQGARCLAPPLGLVTLAAMEIVLGVDNLVFIAILSGKLPPARQLLARRTGLAAALGGKV